ncbi:sphingomyelin phosphodiesterase [Streptomyces sp. NPDC048514]|uniref:sphingomyelin phosphodiesterase n=1 Tax=Streptomyces sp. NPDC048514 TaxID=3365564 RepID=UPI003718C260
MRLRSVLLLSASGILAGACVISTQASAAPAPTESASAVTSLDVVTSNTMLLPSFVTDQWAQDVRGGLIGSAPYVAGHDVMVFQELFDNSASDILMSKLKGYPYRTPVVGRSTSGWDDTQGDYSAFAPEDGGVGIVSRWPITKRIQYIYDDACGTDSASQKGFAYARLNVNGSPVHVIGTHTQADDSLCSTGEAAKIRAGQLREMRNFVDGLHIPASEPVVYAGDFNINWHGPEYQNMLQTLSADEPTYDGVPWTMDPKTNDVAHERYPNDPQQWLDYILFDNRHAHPTTWRNTGLDVSSPPWSLDGKTYHRYSDHYPVQGRS